MAEETDNQNNNFRWILIEDELDRIQRLEKLNEQVSVKVESNSEQIQNIQDKVGDEKNDNVIGSNQLPSTLSSNERKRFENIGKNFIQGASNEFKSIKNAVEFSEKMSTKKNDFGEKIKKLEKDVKVESKKGSFLKSLFKIMGIVGLVALLFKDKLSKYVPDFTKSTSDIFSTIKKFLGNFVYEISNIVIGDISSSLNSSLIHLVNQQFPIMLNIFFNHTLPNILLRSYLTALASLPIPNNAEDRLKELDNKSKNNGDESKGLIFIPQAPDVTYQYIQERTVTRNEKGVITRDEATERDLRDALKNSLTLQLDQQRDFKNLLNEQLTKIFGNKASIEALRDNPAFDMEKFLEEIVASVTDGITKEELIAAYKKGGGNTNLVGDESVVMKEDAVKQIQKAAQAFSTSIVTRIDTLKNKEIESSKGTIQVTVSEDVANTFVTKFKPLLEAITNFFTSSDISNRLTEQWNLTITKFKDFYETQFTNTLGQINEALTKLNSNSIFEKKDDKTIDTVQKEEIKETSLTIKLDLSNQVSGGISTFIQNKNEIDRTTNSLIQQSNKILTDLGNKISDIKDLHAANREEIEKKKQEIEKAVAEIITNHLSKNPLVVPVAQRGGDGVSDVSGTSAAPLALIQEQAWWRIIT